MSKIILLNGCSSAGKSSISEKIMELSQEPWLNFSLSTFWNALSPKYKGFGEKSNEGLQFVSSQDGQGFSINEVKINTYGEKLFNSMPKVFKQLADDGHNIIIEEVILEKKYLENYRNNLKEHQIYFINVYCDLAILEKREKSRGDRILGTNRAQYFKMKDLNWEYDLKIDNSQVSVLDNAEKILELIKKVKQASNKLPNFVRVVIQNEKGELLVIFQKKWNCWVFPGGKIEPGETPEEAAKREVWEETNLVVENLEIVAEQKNKDRMGYLVKANKYSGEIKIKEPKKITDIKFKQIDYEFAVNRLFYAIIFEE